MIYPTARSFQDARQKRVLLFGMSGLGKTHLANMLRDGGGWFHYSVDYRIGTRYMGEYIADNQARGYESALAARVADAGFGLYRLQHHV